MTSNDNETTQEVISENELIQNFTLEEIKEQMALFQRLYYHKTREDPNEIQKRRDYKKKYYYKKKAEREERKKLDEENGIPPPPKKEHPMRKYTKDISGKCLKLIV